MAESNIKYADMKNTFLLWKIQTKQRIEKKKCHALANKIYQLSTYNETWQVWNQHKEQKKMLKLMKRQAKAIHVLSTLKQNMEAWRKRCEHARTCRVKNKQLGLLCQRKLLTFCFVVWKNFSNDYHQRTTRITKLKTLGRNISCRIILTRWQSVLERSRLQERLIQKALQLKRKMILNAWYREFNLIKYKYRKMKELMEIRNSNLCRACFEQWKTYLIIQFQENLKIKKLSIHLKKINVRRYFILWRQWEQTLRLKRQAQARKQEEVNKICVKQLFEIWRERKKLSIALKEKIRKINAIFNIIVQMKYFNAWIIYSKQRLQKKNSDIKVKIYVLKVELRIYFSYWREQRILELEHRRKIGQALIHWSSKLTRNTFNTWLQYSKQKLRKKSRYKAAIEIHKSFVLKQGLRSLLLKGIEEIVSKNEKAMETAHRNEKIIFKYFTRWRRYVHQTDDFRSSNKLPLDLQQSKNLYAQSKPSLNQKSLPRSVHFAKTSRNEPKIPQFLNLQ